MRTYPSKLAATLLKSFICALGLTLCGGMSAYALNLGLVVLDQDFTKNISQTGDATVQASSGDFFLEMSGYGGTTGGASCFASAFWTFQPTEGPLVVNFNGYYYYNYYQNEQDITAKITDLATGTVLLKLTGSDFGNPVLMGYRDFGTYCLDLNPDRIYEFSLTGKLLASNHKEAQLRVSANFSTVPDTGSTFGLTTLAMAGLLALKRLSSFR